MNSFDEEDPLFFTGNLKRDVTRFKKWLHFKYDKNELALYRFKVHRPSLVKELDIPKSLVYTSCKDIRWKWLGIAISEFDKYLLDKLRSDLKEKLHFLYSENKLPIYRGHLSRSRLAPLIGLKPSFLLITDKEPNWAVRCIDEFDTFLKEKGAGGRTVWEQKVPEIRKYLEKCLQDRNLPVNHYGKLNKSAIISRFAPSKNFSTTTCENRNPLLKELLAEYSDIVESETYTQYKYDYLKEELIQLLNNKHLVLNKSKKLNIVYLAKKLDVYPEALRMTPSLSELIKQKQGQIDQCQRGGVTKRHISLGSLNCINLGATPWSVSHQRAFDFSKLINSYGLEFSEKVGSLFIYITKNDKNPKSYYLCLLNYFIWLLTQQKFSTVIDSYKSGEIIDSIIFSRTLLEYRQFCQGDKNYKKYKKFRLEIFTRLSNINLFPSITIKIRKNRSSFNAMKKLASPVPSIAEAEYTDNHQITNIIKSLGDVFDNNRDTIAFVNTLSYERSQRDDLNGNIVDSIITICDERLTEIRVQASQIFRNWYQKYLQGETLLANKEYMGAELKDKLDLSAKSNNRREWNQTLIEMFPNTDKKKLLTNILTLINEEFEGLVPKNDRSYGDLWGKKLVAAGGTNFVQEHLLPSSLAVSAAICLFLCESGANSCVGISLTVPSFRKSKLPGHIVIAGVKERSKGNTIFHDLPITSGHSEIISACEAFEKLRLATQSLRDTGRINKDEFLVYAIGRKLNHINEPALRNNFKKILKSSNNLSKIHITPQMIRPTVLLYSQLKNPNNLTTTNMIAQHKSETTTLGYVNKLPFRIIMEKRIREFTNTLEVLVASQITDGHLRLGLSETEWEFSRKNIQRTGMGGLCTSRTSGVQSDYPEGEKCLAIDRCTTCEKHIVIAHKESIADMIIWQEALNKAEPNFLEHNPERWEQVWTSWQAFFFVVLNEKMTRGELVQIKKEAQIEVSKRKDNPLFVEPQPW